MRKDYKVLLVDVAALPDRGIPDWGKAEVAQSIVTTIMGCWTGA